jgi:hypothetical protein
MTQNAKGPAGASTPCQAEVQSLSRPKEQKMNSTINSACAAKAPAPPNRPTDKEIVAAVDKLMGDIFFLRQAAFVLDEYTCSEFRQSKGTAPSAAGEYFLSQEQVAGIQYMLMHVRDLAEHLERDMDRAFTLEGQI